MVSFKFVFPLIFVMYLVPSDGRSLLYADDEDDYDYDIDTDTEPPKRQMDMSACGKPCQNNGTCVEPGVCRCPPGMAGSECELDFNLKCESLKSLDNAYLHCSDLFNVGEITCYVSCDTGYKTIDGRPAQYLTCLNKKWYMKSRKDGKLHQPKCQNPNEIVDANIDTEKKNETATTGNCNPPCQNNGICSESGTCQCPENTKGKHCELNFNTKCDKSGQLGDIFYVDCTNGQINDDKSVNCQIYCFDGMFKSNLYCINEKWNMKKSTSEEEYSIPTKCEDLKTKIDSTTTSTSFTDQETESTTLNLKDSKTSEYEISTETVMTENTFKPEETA